MNLEDEKCHDCGERYGFSRLKTGQLAPVRHCYLCHSRFLAAIASFAFAYCAVKSAPESPYSWLAGALMCAIGVFFIMRCRIKTNHDK